MQPTFDPSNDGKSRSHLLTLLSLLPYLWPRGKLELRVRVVVALLFLAGSKILMVYVPFLYKEVVDGLNIKTAEVVSIPIAIILAYGGARLLSLAFGELRDAVFAKVGQKALRVIAVEVFMHLHSLSLAFHLERRTGGLSRVIERGTKSIEFLLRFMLFNILPTLFEVGLVVLILFVTYGWQFSSMTFVAVGTYIVFTIAITEWRIQFRREMNRTDSEANTRAIDSLLNFETVKYFGSEKREVARFDESMAGFEQAAILSQTTLATLNIGQAVIVAMGMCSVMLLAAFGIQQGDLTLGDFVLLNTFMMQLYQPLGFLGFVYREIKQSLVDLEKMFELMAVKNEVPDEYGSTSLKVKGAEIEFENVSFSYLYDRKILVDLSFRVQPGRTIAVVGPSGGGKSTIVRLLFRFFDLDSGTIKIDGQDISSVSQPSLRSAIGVVPQDTVLFNDSIEYNIRYGRPDALECDIKKASKLARIDEFIEAQPNGYRTLVGERGLKLSGGEKQRIAIARAILKEPAIMVFDEATSALDGKTEREIQKAVREASKGRTTIVIAHRLSTIVDSDEIIVIDNGRIVERGNHRRLLEQNGVYADLWERQKKQAAAEKKLRLISEKGQKH